MRHPGTRSRIIAVPAFACLLSPAWADAAPARDAGGIQAPPIEEMVVTARKRPEPLQQVPASITVLSGEMLEAIDAQSLADVEYRLPNLASDSSPLTGFGARYVRGLNAGARNIGFDSGYAVFVDGVYSGRYMTADRVLQNVERVEYLPGPQGTLFGKNTTLGVVNIVTRTPDASSTMNLGVGVGSDGHRSVRATAAAPLGDDWSAAAAFGQRQRDGLINNEFLDRQGNNVDQWDGRASIQGNLAEWQVALAGDYYRSTPDLIARQRLEGFGALPPRVASNDLAGSLDDEDYGVSLHAERPVALGTLTSISAFRDYQTAADVDDDAWEVPVQHLVNWTEATSQFSQELRLSGESGDTDYLVGAYFLEQRAESSRSVASFFGQARADGELDSRTWAAFTTVGQAITERLEAEAGLRWTRESKDLQHYSQDGGGVLLDFAISDQRTVSNITPSASVRFALSDSASLFARYAQGFKSGGFNVDLVTAPAMTPLEFDDERVDTVEAGVKTTLLNNRLRLNATVFSSKYRDLQVSQYTVLPGATLPTLRITNAAEAHTQGIELSAELMLARWLLAANVGQTHSEVDDFPDPLGPGTGNYAGNTLGGPEWTSSLLARYTLSLTDTTEIIFSGEHLFQDALGGDLSGDRLAMSDSLSLVNLHAELVFGSARRWRIRGWVDNVFDTDRVVERHRNAAPGLLMVLGFPEEVTDSTVGLYNSPRTYGLQVHVEL